MLRVQVTPYSNVNQRPFEKGIYRPVVFLVSVNDGISIMAEELNLTSFLLHEGFQCIQADATSDILLASST